MKTRTAGIKLGLMTLALGVGSAAQAAAPVITNITMVGATPRFSIQSDLGITNQIQCSTNLGQTHWIVLTNLVVTQSPYWFVDGSAPPAPRRFYRVAALNPTNPPAPTNMALIPAGSFTMGNTFSPSEGYSDELPLHTVHVSAFYMDKYEVTKALWDAVYQWATNRPAEVRYSFEYGAQGKTNNHPAQYMTWYDCVKWCNARSEKEGRTPAYYTSVAQTTVYRTGTNDLQESFVKWNTGYRLPTEAEWEKAARGGASGHRFPWADADTIQHSRANYNVYQQSGTNYYAYDTSPTGGYHTNFNTGGFPYTSPVGYFAANGYGLYDMAGNVCEWCWDFYDGDWYNNVGATLNDTRGPVSSPYGDPYRGLRGGSWFNDANYARCAYRPYNHPGTRGRNLGFRCVLVGGSAP